MGDPTVIAVDCETWLDDMVHPKYGYMGKPPLPVCWSIKRQGKKPILLNQKQGAPIIRQLFKSPDTLLVFHQLTADVIPAIKWCKVPVEHVYAKLDEGLIRDTYVRELLIGTATGDITRAGHLFGLADCLKRYTGIDKKHLKKGEDVWRLRYNELDGMDPQEYPQDAYDYALGDSVDTMKVFWAQERLIHLFEDDEHFQTEMNFVAGMVNTTSPYVNEETVSRFEKKHRKEVARVQKPFIDAGFLRWNKTRFAQHYPKGDKRREGWSENSKVFQAAIEKDYRRQKRPVPRTDPSGKFPEGQIKKDQETLLGCQSKALRMYGRAAQDIKLVNAFVPMLRKAAGHRVAPNYNVLVSTGRMSCVKWDTPITIKRKGVSDVAVEVPISEVIVGDLVWTHKKRWRKVTHTMVSKKQEMFKLTFNTGYTLTCTAEHRLLDSEGNWVLIGDFINEHLTFVGERQEEPESSKRSLQESGNNKKGTLTEGYSETIRHYSAQCNGSVQDNIYQKREGDSPQGSSGNNQKRVSESYVREEGNNAPSVHRRVRRWVRLQDLTSGREESICTPTYNGEGIRVEDITSEHVGTSHRRKPSQQRVGQPGFMYEEGPWLDRRDDEPSLSHASIEVADYAGLFEVYDITVEEDGSYWTLGMYNHNCRKPNMQQLPRAPGARECFEAPEGFIICCLDFDSFEMFGLAQNLYWEFNEHTLLDVLNNNKDPHLMMTATLVGKTYEDVVADYHAGEEFTGAVRQLSKIVNFGAAGGMGADTFLSNMDEDVRETMTELNPNAPLNEVMKEILEEWKDQWGMRQYFQWVSKKTRGGRKFDYVHPWSGRKRGHVGYTDGCNLPFQGICADAFKAQAIEVMRELLIPGSYLHEKQVELGALLHDENMCMGPPDTVRKWAGRVRSIMCEAARQVMPDCKIRAGAEVTGRKWRKAGVTIEEFETLQLHNRQVDDYLDARTVNKKLSIREFVNG